jgi:peroxiredoxin Q/BCP
VYGGQFSKLVAFHSFCRLILARLVLGLRRWGLECSREATVLEIGNRAPEFTLAAHHGRDLSLTSFLNHGPLLLYFYPADFTPICTRQAAAISKIYDQLTSAGIQIAGISPQSVDSHRRFQAQHGLKQILLADPEHIVTRMYEARGPMGIGMRRVTYLIDQGKAIRGAHLADFRILSPIDFMLESIPLMNAVRVQLQQLAEAAAAAA